MQKRLVVFGVFLLCFIYFVIVASAADVGVTNPGKSEIPEMDIGQIQTSGKEIWIDNGVTIEINYDELKQNKDKLHQALDSCPFPTIIDCDKRCGGLKSIAGTDCYQACNREQNSKINDYKDCLYLDELESESEEAISGWSMEQIIWLKANHLYDSFCPSAKILLDQAQACEKTCPGNQYSMDPEVSGPYWECWLGFCRRNHEKQWFNSLKCEIQAYATTKSYFNKWLELVGGEVPSGKEEPEMDITERSLLESVAAAGKKHEEDLQSVQNYWARPQATFPGMTQNEEGAKKKFKDSEPLQIQVGKARFAYEDALKKGASKEELAKLKNNYDNSAKDLKKQLQNVLSEDSGNSDASFVLGTLSKWDGNNKLSYEYNRDALASLQARNPFEYKRRMDMINEPMRMELLQALEPEKKLITLPTIETSPILKGLKENIKTFTNPLKESIRQTAEDIEKTARGLSLSKYLPEKFLPERFQELRGLGVKEK